VPGVTSTVKYLENTCKDSLERGLEYAVFMHELLDLLHAELSAGTVKGKFFLPVVELVLKYAKFCSCTTISCKTSMLCWDIS